MGLFCLLPPIGDLYGITTPRREGERAAEVFEHPCTLAGVWFGSLAHLCVCALRSIQHNIMLHGVTFIRLFLRRHLLPPFCCLPPRGTATATHARSKIYVIRFWVFVYTAKWKLINLVSNVIGCVQRAVVRNGKGPKNRHTTKREREREKKREN